MKKIICVGVMMSMCLSLFTACPAGSDIDYGYVRAYIKKEYYEKFNAKEFMLEDFGLENVESFSYFYYHEYAGGDTENNKFILLKLKKTGKKYANEAIEHLAKLQFVSWADFRYLGASPGTEF